MPYLKSTEAQVLEMLSRWKRLLKLGLLQIYSASDEAEKEMYKKTAASNLMESACVDHMFVISNPAHFQCTDNWVVREVGPPTRDKAEAMERVRVRP